MHGDREALREIADCLSRIEEYTSEGREWFFKNPMIQEGVVYNFLKIAGAVRQVSDGVKEATPEIPWSGLERIADQLYDHKRRVDLDQVWSIIEEEIYEIDSDMRALVVLLH